MAGAMISWLTIPCSFTWDCVPGQPGRLHTNGVAGPPVGRARHREVPFRSLAGISGIPANTSVIRMMVDEPENVQGFFVFLASGKPGSLPSFWGSPFMLNRLVFCFSFAGIALPGSVQRKTRFSYAGSGGQILLVGLFYLNYYFLLPRFSRRNVMFLIWHWSFYYSSSSWPSTCNPRMGISMASPTVTILQSTGFPIRREDGGAKQIPVGQLVGFPGPDPLIPGIPGSLAPVAEQRHVLLPAYLFLGGFIRMALSFARSQNEKRAGKRPTACRTEFSESTDNPHFLFNTLNGIYSPGACPFTKTESAILQLSGLLRYQLYEAQQSGWI